MKAKDITSIEVHTIGLVMIDRLDKLEDESKRGVKYYTKKLIEELEKEDKELSEISSNASEILSGGFRDMLEEVINNKVK